MSDEEKQAMAQAIVQEVLTKGVLRLNGLGKFYMADTRTTDATKPRRLMRFKPCKEGN